MDISSTPAEIRESENIFPGENWFCYWRTSASLWESKLRSLSPQTGPLFIPLYWGFHTDNGEDFDFGNIKPEADLERLNEMTRKTGHDVIWLVPLSPIPIQPCGGLPALIARYPSQDKFGMTHAFLDSDGTINKIHSFYDPKVYQCYRKWIWNLEKFLTDRRISVPVIGLNSFWVDAAKQHSFIEDYSPTFASGFVRYLKGQKLATRINDEGVEVPKLTKEDETFHQAKYRKLISDLYSQTATEGLKTFWVSQQDYAFLGGAPQDIFARSSEVWPHQIELMQDLWTHMEWNLMPNSTLIAHKDKKNIIGKFLKDYLTPHYVRSTLQHLLSDETESGHFAPLVLFDIYWENDYLSDPHDELSQLGLLSHLQRDFRSCWRLRGRFEFQREADEDSTHRLKFFFGSQVDKIRFNHILRLFLNGHRIILDRRGLDPLLSKKLQLFITENSLVVQDINFLTKISLIKLGEGILLIHDGEALKEQQATKKLAFWDHITKYLQVKHLALNGEEPMFFTWKTRASSSFELNYNEVRRLSIYNPLTQRVRYQIPSTKQFVFIKAVDPERAQIKSSPMGVEVEIMAGGSISLDFGHFEEN